MTNKIEAQAAERDIPSPPSGGSWTFDRMKGEWVSNDPVEPIDPVDQPVAFSEE